MDDLENLGVDSFEKSGEATMKYGVTIAIKALNEEKNISRALESAVSAIGEVAGEVVLSDSGSVDATVEIAMQWPVRIVQLRNPSDKCCGAGAQLAFQAAQYKYLYLMDADMVVHPKFLRAGIAYLEQNGSVAGVGGILREQNTQNNQFKILAKSLQTHQDWLPGPVGRLDGGGLYRMSAIHEVGYFGDRNLHAFEEFDLAARLRSHGWALCRIAEPSVDHFGHKAGSYALLLRRVRSGYSRAAGEVLRGALGQPHFSIVASDLTHIRNGLAVLAWVGTLLVTAAMSVFDVSFLGALVILAVLPILLLSIRRGSLSLGVYSLASWLVSAIGMVDGFFRLRVDPRVPLQYTVLK